MDAPRTNLRPSGRALWLIPVVAVIATGLYVVFHISNRPQPPAPAPSAVATPSPPDASAAPPVTGAASDLPVGATGARSLLESVSTNALVRKWLGHADLIHRWAVIIENVAEGASPRRALDFLAPQTPFAVEWSGDRLVISSESFARYDAVADAINSIDARALATAYHRLHAVLEAAYRSLGLPRASIDSAMANALHRIDKAPLETGEVFVEREDGLYVFADPRLERLGDVDKHLLRMGPRNERLVQAKARELMQALHLPAVAAR